MFGESVLAIFGMAAMSHKLWDIESVLNMKYVTPRMLTAARISSNQCQNCQVLVIISGDLSLSFIELMPDVVIVDSLTINDLPWHPSLSLVRFSSLEKNGNVDMNSLTRSHCYFQNGCIVSTDQLTELGSRFSTLKLAWSTIKSTSATMPTSTEDIHSASD